MDMGCHGIAFCYWFLDRPAQARHGQMNTHVHGDKTRGEDDCIVILEFEGGGVGWSRMLGAPRRHGRPGRDLRLEGLHVRQPAHGQRAADLQRARLRLRRREGADHEGLDVSGLRGALELRLPAGDAPLRPLRARKESPIATGEDGRVVQEVLFAGYQSMGAGQRVDMPFNAYGVKKPIDLSFDPKR